MGGGAGRRGPREVDVALNPEELPGSPIGGELRKELMGKVPPDGEPGVARIRVDEDVLMHLANALGPRRHTHMFAAMTCISAAGLVVLIAIAIGGIIKLDELNQEIGSLQEIQESIAGMAAGVTKMSDEVGNLTNIANVVGDAFGQGASATLSGLLGNGVNAITNAISRGGSGGGANLTAPIDPYAGCDPDGANFTACLQDPPGGGGGNSTVWGNLLRGVVGGLGRVASNLIEGVRDDGADAPPPGPP